MKIKVDFSDLFACAKEMGATIVKENMISSPNASHGLSREEWAPIKKEIDLNEIGSTQGLLRFIDERGVDQQVLLYIEDHGWSIEDAIYDIKKRRKFHVADCSTLQKKRGDGTFERYVMTNDFSNQFSITGMEKKSVKVELQVCKNCLKSLNYKNYSCNLDVFNKFSISEFFATYSSFFASLPSRFSGEDDGSYTDDWKIISAKYRASKNYSCEYCAVDLSKNKHLLHTHHKSGVKTDNNLYNLQALCIDCHRKQAHHGHLFVHHEDMVTINNLRRNQGQLKQDNWREVFKFADAALHGLLAKCEHDRCIKPVVAYEMLGGSDEIIAELELAWPKSKNCIVINDNHARVARSQGWHVWTMIEAMDDFLNFKVSVNLGAPPRAR
ncbi:hypothetical protein BJAS_P4460 [Bathymodiolus japonicus methanotrophic gill symbiont]|uniref:HNH endonuclease n=1 Tax=Bathymodiolus japonicus methanotrophic gill symbiont TaxID=113269 RepID=UPI001B489766|nr:HNH endonuclease [Bathymodiolus japonicus methanotrophic gill symbiont]GFO73574.1 hypothetical protein BJAS_P4460 [Bathymodiolus japonicus methanotrophic gill symbiont]